MRLACLILTLSGWMLTQDQTPVAMSLQFADAPQPFMVAGRPGVLKITLVDSLGRVCPLNGITVGLQTTDPRSKLNGLQVPLAGGSALVKVKWFTASESHKITASTASGLKGELGPIQVVGLPKDLKVAIDHPKPPCGHAFAGGSIKFRGRATTEGNALSGVCVTVPAPSGAVVYPSDIVSDSDGSFEFTLFAPEFICPKGVNGTTCMDLNPGIDANGDTILNPGETDVELPPIGIVEACPQQMIPTALFMLRILASGGILLPPDDVLVSPVSGLDKLTNGLRSLEKTVADVQSGKWTFDGVRKDLRHIADYLRPIASARPVVQRLDCSIELMNGNPDKVTQKLPMPKKGNSHPVAIGFHQTIGVSNTGPANRALTQADFTHCFKPSIHSVAVEGSATASPSPFEDMGVDFECTGPGKVTMTTTTEFGACDVIVIPPPGDGGPIVVLDYRQVHSGAVDIIGAELAFQIHSTFLILQKGATVISVEWAPNPKWDKLADGPVKDTIRDRLSNNVLGGKVQDSGKRMFPDKLTTADKTPENERDIIKVLVLVRDGENPVKDVKVFVRSWDVDDPFMPNKELLQEKVDDENNADDNRGNPVHGEFVDAAGQSLDSKTSGVTNADGIAEFLFRVSRRAGDNYRVVASLAEALVDNVDVPQNDGAQSGLFKKGTQQRIEKGEVDGVRTSETLTVWHLFHVEVDSMAALPDSGKESGVLKGNIRSITVHPKNEIRILTDLDFENPPSGPDPSRHRETKPDQDARHGRFEDGTIEIEVSKEKKQYTALANGKSYVIVKDFKTDVTVYDAKSGKPLFDGNFTELSFDGETATVQMEAGLVVGRPADVQIKTFGINRVVCKETSTQQGIFTAKVEFKETHAFSLTDDDTGELPFDVQKHSALIQETLTLIYGDAFYGVAVDGGEKTEFNTKDVAPKLNNTDQWPEVIQSSFNSKDRRKDYWVVYTQFTYQQEPKFDGDPDSEFEDYKDLDILGIGIASAADGVSVVIIEACKEVGVKREGQIVVMAHEIGHLFGLPNREREEKGLMADGQPLTRKEAGFNGDDLNHLRNRQ